MRRDRTVQIKMSSEPGVW